MPLTATEVAVLIQRALPDAVVTMAAVTADGETVRACVSSKVFAGLNADERHELVFAALTGRRGAAPRALKLASHVLA